MKKSIYRITISLVMALGMWLVSASRNNVRAQSVTITSVGGYSDGVGGVVNGRWTGQPSRAPSSASNQYKGFLAVDTWNSASTWTISGSGFGTTPGSVSFDAGIVGPLPFSVSSYMQWTNTQIQVRVVGFWSFTAARNVKIVVRTAQGTSTSKVENIVAVPAGRGYGQCTWEVFYQRKSVGLNPPPTAYPSNRVSIGAKYIPHQWDVLFWNTEHTAIITSVPQVTRSSDGKTTTYRFTLTERNADWRETMTTRSSEFSVRNGVVIQGILSNMSKTLGATSYWN